MKYPIELTATAQADLVELFTYIQTTLLSAQTARNQVARIREVIFSLERMPDRFPLIPREITGELGIRKVLVDNYIVFYLVRPAPPTVYVLRVVYGRRNWLALLNGMGGSEADQKGQQ